MTVAEITSRLYAGTPPPLLFHYTALGSTLDIIETQTLRAAEVRFFNDAAEMNHALELLKYGIAQRLVNPYPNAKLLTQFSNWLGHRLTFGHMIFVTSFSAKGNLLSQWRGYCPAGRGVSLGFSGEKLRACAAAQSFQLVKCIYDPAIQQEIAGAILDAVEALGSERGENADRSKRHPTESFNDVFEEVEVDLLRVAALLKHPEFHEEEEWRVVSPAISNYVTADIEYREGVSTLVPFLRFKLPEASDRRVDIEVVYVGPTPNINNSVSSLSKYLSKRGANPRTGTLYCAIPFRTI